MSRPSQTTAARIEPLELRRLLSAAAAGAGSARPFVGPLPYWAPPSRAAPASCASSADANLVGLDRMGRLDLLAHLAPHRFIGGQSSYERNGGNADWNHYLRVEGNGERVILDERGRGVLTRMWFTRVPPDARLRMYFDGETTPRVDETIHDIVSGRDARFLAPLVAGPDASSGGYVSYVPQPYREALKITVTGAADLYYNVGYQSLAPDADVTTWTGAEESRATRDLWNQVSRDPKGAAGNTTAAGTVDLPAGAAMELLALSGPRSIASLKLKIPGVAAVALPREQVTDDGRAHRGYSEFTLSLPGGTSPVLLIRRLDHGIADQKANVFVDGIPAGEWFDGGADNTDHWRDSTFVLPTALTNGRTSVRVRVQFVSAAVDWNEFRYAARINGAEVDVVDVGNAASETAHGYVIDTPTWEGTRTFTYPPPPASAPRTDAGRAHRGTSRFTLALDPGNRGAILTRQLDFGLADQRAEVYVDGLFAGEWFDPGSNAVDRWKHSSFYLPEQLTLAKTSVDVEIRFTGAAHDWTEFSYEARSITGDGEVVTDRLDVGAAASEAAHAYAITAPTFAGARTFTFPHAAADAKEILNQTWLRIYYDGEATPSVDAPLGSFFAMGQYGPAVVRALPVGIDEDQFLYAYFPMPFRDGARIELVNQRGVALNGARFEIQHQPFTGNFDEVGYFRTFFNPQLPTVEGGDILILDTAGIGKLVGVTQTMAGEPGNSRWYLEGDERIHVDGSRTPVVHGTGTEDFYDGAFYFDRGPYTNPLSGNPLNIIESLPGGSSRDVTTTYRFLLHDAVEFRRHLRVSIEHGAVNDEIPDIWTLAYYYQVPATSGPRDFGAVRTDALDVGDPASEAAHGYVIDNQTWQGAQTFTFEGDFDTVPSTENGRAHRGVSAFDVAIAPNNDGVILRRQLDQGIGDQRANAFVDNVLVGQWHKAGENPFHPWAEDDFLIPASLTAGRSTLRVRIEFVSSEFDWNEFGYEVFTLVPVDLTPPRASSGAFGHGAGAGHAVSVAFSEPVKDLHVSDLSLMNLSSGAAVPAAGVSYDPATTTARWNFPTPLPDGYYQATIAADDVTDLVGNPLASDHVYAFFTSTGSAGRDVYQLSVSDGDLLIAKNATTPTFSVPLANLRAAVIDAGDGDDEFALTLAAGMFPPDETLFHGGAGSDTLRPIAASGSDPVTIDAARILLGTSSADISAVEALQLVRGTFNLPSDAAGVAIEVQANATAFFGVSQRLASLHVAGTARLRAGLLRHGGLSFAGAGRLDLDDAAMIVDYVSDASPLGGWTGTRYDGVTGMIADGRNGGAWNGSGLVSSAAAGTGAGAGAGAGNRTTLGVAEAADVLDFAAASTALFAGQTVDPTTVLVKYTWGGDANLDGRVNIDDYGRIDSNVGSGASGWFDGDFNYDGKINIDDYGIIDTAVSVQADPP